MKIGDKVKLKSGGPNMTVIATNREETKGLMTWFPSFTDINGEVGYEQPQEKWLHKDAVEPIT